MCVAFFIAKSSQMCQKSPNWMLSLCFKARHPFSMMKGHDPCCFQVQRRREGSCSLQSSPWWKSKKQKTTPRQTHTHTQTPKNMERPAHSKFKFQIQIARNRARGSERCYAPRLSVYVDSDVVRLYLAGKASCWHAGVLLAAPTVLVHAEVCKRVWQSSKFK